eukprot:CAMPEP_0172551410 /NCGR_PEP_ID=MMETSP1067-20121228/39222_1 /TAXON_ID=265564 ORGANISM="Thalassiosira punctigera, Strain Tpunct2005C2" /NCGR_SAMPLE_ID=MMETSP1067 /ASSEMBLY_ACC=CAM_ASM_000444 /LENGTH=63 /DNA_ID=CAMNT_0013339195 /DNA_START=591 /DNA_END=780 /DNA_ORIENTATION=-
MCHIGAYFDPEVDGAPKSTQPTPRAAPTLATAQRLNAGHAAHTLAQPDGATSKTLPASPGATI